MTNTAMLEMIVSQMYFSVGRAQELLLNVPVLGVVNGL